MVVRRGGARFVLCLRLSGRLVGVCVVSYTTVSAIPAGYGFGYVLDAILVRGM